MSSFGFTNQKSGWQFPGGSTSTQPATTSLGATTFGATAGAPPAGALQASLMTGNPVLGDSILNQTPAAMLDHTLTALGRVSAGQSSYFDHMIQRAQKEDERKSGVDSSHLSSIRNVNPVPNLQFGLGDIAQRVRDIGAGSDARSRRTAGVDNAAHYMLAASGVPVVSASRKLDTIAERIGAAPLAGPNDFEHNIEGYVAGVASQTTLDIIGEGLEQARRDFDSFLQENIHMEWDVQRQRIYEHFGFAKPTEDSNDKSVFGKSSRYDRPFGRASTFGAVGAHQSVIGNPNNGGVSGLGVSVLGGRGGAVRDFPPSHQDLAQQRERQEFYMNVIHKLNVARLSEKSYNLLHSLHDVEKGLGNDSINTFDDAFLSLIYLTKEIDNSVSRTDPEAVPERVFAEQFLKRKSEDPIVRARILAGSRRALENSFIKKIETVIQRHPKEANVGGIPSGINKVRAYIRVGMALKEFGTEDEVLQYQMLNDDYLWLLIYFLIRCGLLEEASHFVSSNARAIQGIDRHFPQIISHYARDPERNLTLKLRSALIREWETQKKYPQEQVDPYRMACYKIIGRTELERRALPGVNISHDDWTWLQFALARESTPTEEFANTVFNLESLRQSVLDIGARHFSGGADSIDSPGTYFTLLILCGLYEKAVAWLYDFNPIASVHFAIALSYYGLLRVSDITQKEMLAPQEDGTHKINFALLVGHYTADFRAAHPEYATDYLSLICLNSDLSENEGKRQIEICHEALRELVLETREFTLLLGDIMEDGSRVHGAIENRLKLIKLNDHDAFFRKISIQAAAVAEDCSRISDAVILYHLSTDYDSVVKILSRTLADVVCTEIGEEPLRLDPVNPKAPVLPEGTLAQDIPNSLSLTSVDDPTDLADKVYTLYSTQHEIYQLIQPQSWKIFGVLKKLAHARNWVSKASSTAIRTPLQTEFPSVARRQQAYESDLETGAWDKALNLISATGVLPLGTNGDIAAIREFAATFSTYPPELARTIGPLLLFTVTAHGRKRDQLRASMYMDNTRNDKIKELSQAAKDLMVYAGLIRYRLESRVFEALARIGADFDV